LWQAESKNIMAAPIKTKLCWNCEGNVSQKDETCPYCGVSVETSTIPGTAFSSEPASPPYPSTKDNSAQSIPDSPYAKSPDDTQSENQEKDEEVEAPSSTSNLQRTAMVLSALSFGVILSLFAVILLLFADDKGIMTLHWNSSYWYVYLILGLPLVYIGWKASASLEDDLEKKN
jgi:hypothetical protein